MSDTMLLGVLRMPIPPQPDSMMLTQFVCRAREAADRIESDAKTIADLRAELARALRDRDNALELAAQACVDEVNRNMDEYTRLPENVTRRVIYAAMGVSAANCRDSIREIIDAASRPNPPQETDSAP